MITESEGSKWSSIIKIKQNLYLTFSKICVIINMLSGKDKAIGESPMAQHSPGAIEFVEDSVKCR